MKKTFYLEDHVKLKSLSIIEREENYYLEIETKSDIDTSFLKRQIDSFCMGAESDGEFECNFKIYQENKVITLSGNLHNALLILSGRGLLNDNLIKLIQSDPETQKTVEKSKSYLSRAKLLLNTTIEYVDNACRQLPSKEDRAILIEDIISNLESKKSELINCGQQHHHAQEDNPSVKKVKLF